MKHKMLQLIRDNASEEQPAITTDATQDTAHIYVRGVIDPMFGASAADLITALSAAGGKPISLHINSPGGDVFESSDMASAIAAYPASVTAYIDGMAASAATRLALACSQVHMASSGLFMIHRSWTMAWGNEAELTATASLLRKVDGTIAADYTRKTGAPLAQVQTWMADETWFTADEAKAAGFIDNVFSITQAATGKTQDSAARWNLSAYANAPKLPEPAAPTDDSAATAAAIHQQLAINRNRLRLMANPI